MTDKLTADLFSDLFEASPNEQALQATTIETPRAAALEEGQEQAVVDIPAASPVAINPHWADNLRQTPNVFVRSGLFTVGNNKNRRKYWTSKAPMTVETYGNFSMLFRGEELRQDDFDLLMELMHIVRGQPSNTKVHVCPMHLIRDMEWSRNKDSYDRLEKSILRLQMGVISIVIQSKKKDGSEEVLKYHGAFVKSSAMRDNIQGEQLRSDWVVEINPELFRLFNNNDFTRFSWEHRKEIGSPLAKWLHGFFSSHDGSMGVPLERLMKLSGYADTNPAARRKFKMKVREYLTAMKDNRQIIDWQITEDNRVRVIPLKWNLNAPRLSKPTQE